MHKTRIHPSVRLLTWVVLLLVVQGLDDYWLFGGLMLSPFVGRRALRRARKLIWRTRWVLFSVLAFFAWGEAGDAVWDSRFAPTVDGLFSAATHLGRLLLVLVALAAFLETMSMADLLAATRGLLKPLRRFGLDPDRGVIRLMLVLRFVEDVPRPRDWKVLLQSPAQAVTESVEINDYPFGVKDGVLTVFLLAVPGLLWVLMR